MATLDPVEAMAFRESQDLQFLDGQKPPDLLEKINGLDHGLPAMDLATSPHR